MKKSAARAERKAPRPKLVLNPPPAPEPATWVRWWPVALLVAVSFGIYAHSLWADFLRWDDRQNILLNPWIENSAWSLLWTRPYYNMYIPVTYSFWTILWHITSEPWIFHLANLVCHSINTVLVYMIARRLLQPEEKIAALFAALIFACHPLQVETVAWISTGRDLLAGVFSLTAVYLILQEDKPSRQILSTVLFCISLLCKPSVAIIPPAVLFVGYGCRLLTKHKIQVLAFWFLPALAASYVTKAVQQLDADLRLKPMPLFDRAFVAVDSLSFYVQKLFVPYPLASDYGRTPDVALDDIVWQIAIGVIAALAIAGWTLRKRIPVRMFYFAGLFVLLLSPILGLIPFQAQGQSTVSDRYAYMPMIGAGLFLGALFGRRKLWAVGGLVVATLATMTVLRAEVWQTNEAFFRDMLAKNENSHVALSSLGVEFILSGKLNEAEQVLNRATQLKPKDVIPRTNLAQLYLLQNRPDRVVNEVVPLLEDKDFLYQNQTETRALASAYRLAGRAFWAMSLWSRGNDYFCRWFNLDYENEEGKAEVMRFLEDAKHHGADLKNCEVKVRN